MNKKICRKVNRRARQLNKQLANDVFGNRFWVRQVQKQYKDDVHYFLYELRDRLQPERNRLVPGWLSEFAIMTFNDLAIEMNDFIITSDFWQTYKK